jgi:hypothetical protein
MNPKDVVELIAALREQGVTHFKHGDLELTLGPAPRPQGPKLVPSTLEKPPIDSDKEIPGVVHEMRTVFAMKDEDLVERLFPIPKEDEA